METKTASKAYQEALEAARIASAQFAIVRDQYRAGKISDTEFLAAKKVYDAAGVAFDAAYAKEAN